MFAYTTAAFDRRHLPSRLRRLGLPLLLTCATLLRAAVVEVHDEGVGNDYMSGDPVTLPAARLSTNRFGDGVQCILNRPHCVRPAAFDGSGRLDLSLTSDEVVRPGTNGFPAYLVGQQYVCFLQDVRHYTNYTCRVTVDCPSTFYLLVDNRVNEFGPDKPYSDPVFGPPDTEWIPNDSWERVNTGLTPAITTTNRGDYVGIDEGCNGTLNQVYAIYGRTLSQPGSVTLRTQFEGNIYCLVVSTNVTRLAGPKPTPLPTHSAQR
jgi:hypothetical protein